ncbi:MAG: type II toxin-antitoxin system Phd/YefM family antitoxin [Proteobacteria bacterium]|nr:type II toxin-antitoxin system Phd/YefM family antitoxin [Pseudomonadota bacterium]
MPTFTIHQAKTQLSDLIRRAEAGEEIVIARGDVPVVTLVKLDREDIRAKRRAGLGSLVGKLAPIPDAALIGGMTDEELEDAFGAEFVRDASGPAKS